MSKSGIDTRSIQEAFEQQSVAQRIQVGDAQRVRDQRAGPGTASGPDRNTVFFAQLMKSATIRK
jgi:hypothetical protein